ncbi:hypothetical protein KY335_04395 [Candidatus Woesearchaeota archaeon]|nr:hypothetical protein [Candidatus Woesearchaeota archaeon]
MNNFFSGHNMAMEVLGHMSPLHRTDRYLDEYRIGGERCVEIHHDRLNVDYETTKPFLPVPEPVSLARLPELTAPRPLPELERPSLYLGLGSLCSRSSSSSISPFDFVKAMQSAERERKKTAMAAAGLLKLEDLDRY